MSNYKENRKRVYEICGIDIKDRKYNCHHIIFRSDLKKGIFEDPEYDIDQKGNLFPLLILVHNYLHVKVAEQEGYPDPNGGRMSRRKKKRKKKRRH